VAGRLRDRVVEAMRLRRGMGSKSASSVSSERARSGLKLPKGRWRSHQEGGLFFSHSLFSIPSQHATVWHDVHAHDERVRARRPCHASSVPEGYARVIEFIRDDVVNDPFSSITAVHHFTRQNPEHFPG